MEQRPQPAAGEFRRHGVLLLPALIGNTLNSVNGYSIGTMIGPLQHEFGWTRAEIMIGPSINAVLAFLFSPLVGRAVDRFGPRLVAIVGVLAFTGSFALLSTATAGIWSWWLHWLLLGAASTLVLPTVWIAAINSVFDAHRGKALAIVLLGTGVATAVVPSITSALLDRLDWRMAYVVLATGSGAIVLALVLPFFRVAADAARAKGVSPAAVLSGFTVSEGIRSPAFFRLCLGVFVFGASSLALTVNAVPVLQAGGFQRSGAAAIAGMIGIGSIAGRLLGGLLLDRFDARIVAVVNVLTPVLAILLLLLVPGSALFAAAAMLMLGLSLGAEVDACSYLAARHFGMRSFGVLFGTINGCVTFGAGLAPVVSNYVFDVTRSYDPVLWATVPLCVLAAVLFGTLGRYPDFPPAEAAEEPASAALALA